MREFFKFKALLYELTTRDIKVKYRRSILGLLWTVLNPLLMMLILCFVFSQLFRFDIENYAIYVLSGQVIFNYFQISTTDAMMSILNNGTLIKKVYIPKYMLVLVKILSGTVYLLASFAALLIVMGITGNRIRGTVIFFIIPFLCLILFSRNGTASCIHDCKISGYYAPIRGVLYRFILHHTDYLSVFNPSGLYEKGGLL